MPTVCELFEFPVPCPVALAVTVTIIVPKGVAVGVGVVGGVPPEEPEPPPPHPATAKTQLAARTASSKRSFGAAWWRSAKGVRSRLAKKIHATTRTSATRENADGHGRIGHENRRRGGTAAAAWVVIVKVVVCTVSFPSNVTGVGENSQVALVGSPAHVNVAVPA
jgi:hypothetical protein